MARRSQCRFDAGDDVPYYFRVRRAARHGKRAPICAGMLCMQCTKMEETCENRHPGRFVTHKNKGKLTHDLAIDRAMYYNIFGTLMRHRQRADKNS